MVRPREGENNHRALSWCPVLARHRAFDALRRRTQLIRVAFDRLAFRVFQLRDFHEKQIEEEKRTSKQGLTVASEKLRGRVKNVDSGQRFAFNPDAQVVALDIALG